MAAQGSSHANAPGAGTEAGMTVMQQTPAEAVRIVVLTVGAIAVWMAAVLGFQQVAEHTFDFTPLDAWALSLAIITYLAMFIGVIVGIVMLVHQADEDFLARTERSSPHVVHLDAAATPVTRS
jgi:hypothetical protein